MSWKSRARWSKKRVARLGSGSRCCTRFSSRLVYLGSFPQGSRRLPSGAASLRQLCRWCPRCPPPVNIHNVFRIFFGQDVISTRDLPNPSNDRIAFGYSQIVKKLVSIFIFGLYRYVWKFPDDSQR